MKKAAEKILKYLIIALALASCVAFVIKFAEPNLLKQYLSYGIGNCQSIPVLCLIPEDQPTTPKIKKEYLSSLVPYVFPRMSLSCPKGFDIVQELIKKPYHKKQLGKGPIIYLLYQAPQTLIILYPEVKKEGINDNWAFVNRLEHADFSKITRIIDAFFVIMKSVWTPDLGNQKIARMVSVEIGDKKGIINYNLSGPDNYFDCNIVDAKDNFFKVYIKDKGGKLNLDKVYAIISTIEPI